MHKLLNKLFDNARIDRRLTESEALDCVQREKDEAAMWDMDGTKSPYAWSDEAGENA